MALGGSRMKASIVLAAVALVVAAGLARAGGDGKSVEERLVAIEARLDRIEARLEGGGTPSQSGTLAALTPAQRAALVVVAKLLKFYRAGKAADLAVDHLNFYSALTP